MPVVAIVIAGCAVALITFGPRSVFGLFLLPMSQEYGWGRDVFGLAIGGRMNKQIAAARGVSEITAQVHKRRVMEKMEARSLADLVRMAGELGIDAPRQR